MCVLAAVALVAVISTSCNKNCTCKSKDGKISVTYTKEDLEKYNLTCADMKNATAGSDEVTCK